MATDVDFENQKVICKDVNHLNNNAVTTFELPYDHLVVAVGAINNTFGTPGVYENCFFLKEMEGNDSNTLLTTRCHFDSQTYFGCFRNSQFTRSF